MQTASLSPDSTRPLQRIRALALFSCLGLITLGMLWETLLAPIGNKTLALKVLPLCFGLVGIWRYRMYTYRWLSLLVWLYVLEGAVRAYSDAGISRQLAWLEIVLSVLLFLACVLHVHVSLPRQRKNQVNNP